MIDVERVEGISRRAGLVVLGITSGSVVASEVLFTRLLSVSTWYGLAFLVLSLAMLGMTRGSLDALGAKGAPMAPWIAKRLTALSAGLVVATIAILDVPLTFSPDATSFASILVIVAAVTVPMVAGGSVIARIMTESDVPVARVYAVDLVTAAGGALVPLMLLGPLTTPSSVLAIAVLVAGAAAVVADEGAKRLPRIAVAVSVALLLLTQATSHGLVIKFSKGVPRPDDRPLFEADNPLSHVTLPSFVPRPFALWSYGGKEVLKNHPMARAQIDGEAATEVYAYSSIPQLEAMKSDAVTVAHVLRPDGAACVIGIGGGRDLESALLYGHSRVTGFEINPAMVAMLRSVAVYSPILKDPRVTVVLGDGRAALAQSDAQCRVLQASLVDTWAATSAGAFAHTEATLYTREAWRLFLSRVEPDGILTFSRWYEPTRPSETSRLVSLAVASLLDRGEAMPRDHVALVAAGKVATILVSPAPLTPADVDALHATAEKYSYTLLAAPGETAKDPTLEAILAAHTIDALTAAGVPKDLDTSPPDDDRPFFFQILAPRAWLHPFDVMKELGSREGGLGGNVSSAFELLLTLVAVLFVAALLLGPTLVSAARAPDPPLPGVRAALFFAALGAGFMIAEIALVQRLHVVLGHPTYALVVVLAGLLVATGVGSALSEKIVRSPRAVSVLALVAAVLLAALPWLVIHPLARATIASSFGVRVAWTGATAGAVGLVLGTLFPSGLRFAGRDRATAVALAINGASSVVGSVVAILVSVADGIPASFVVAACIYVAAAACGPVTWRAAT
jgi:SAM-dependent methyltransferase